LFQGNKIQAREGKPRQDLPIKETGCKDIRYQHIKLTITSITYEIDNMIKNEIARNTIQTLNTESKTYTIEKKRIASTIKAYNNHHLQMVNYLFTLRRISTNEYHTTEGLKTVYSLVWVKYT
jgi:hypothetical protein